MVINSKINRAESKQVEEDIQRLREWLNKQPHLPHDIDDELLRAYVCGTKSLEIAKQKLDSWYTARGKFPQLFGFEPRNPLTDKWKEQSKAIKSWFMPEATPEGYRVFYIQTGEDFSTFYHPQKIARTTMMIELGLSMWPDMKGLICVYDTRNLPSNILTKLSVPLTAAALTWFQNTVPLKLKKVIIFNAMPFADLIMTTLIKPFMKEKLYNRITVTSEGPEAMKKHITDEVIPEDMGGTGPNSDELNEKWLKLFEERADWFRHMAHLVSDERKRPADANGAYGVEGTFRSLAID